jgi:archaellum component FlaC
MEATYFEIEDELNKIQTTVDDLGKNISDQSPLLKIKKAIEKVKKDI